MFILNRAGDDQVSVETCSVMLSLTLNNSTENSFMPKPVAGKKKVPTELRSDLIKVPKRLQLRNNTKKGLKKDEFLESFLNKCQIAIRKYGPELVFPTIRKGC